MRECVPACGSCVERAPLHSWVNTNFGRIRLAPDRAVALRVVKARPTPKLSALAARQRAAAIRERIEATVVRRVPQVMVKVTGGGRGMKAIAAHRLAQQIQA